MEPLLNIERAAEMLSLSPWTIRSWIRKRKLKAIKLGSRIVVELENMLERAVTLCGSGAIGEADLRLRSTAPPEGGDSSPSTANLGSQVENIQRQAIIDALEKTRYNKTAAAKLLGLSFRQLRYRIKKLGIE